MENNRDRRVKQRSKSNQIADFSSATYRRLALSRIGRIKK